MEAELAQPVVQALRPFLVRDHELLPWVVLCCRVLFHAVLCCSVLCWLRKKRG